MGPDVHFRRTYAWALEEGLGPGTAEIVAAADVGFDEIFPARRSIGTMLRHFAPAAWAWSRAYFRQALRSGDPVLLGWGLHCAQDAVAHGTLGERHLLFRAGLGRDPDLWEQAPPGVRRRIERVTRARLREFRDTRFGTGST